MDIILRNNIFVFHDSLYRQEIGCAMGTKPAPSYANIFMAKKIDNEILKIAEKYCRDDKRPASMSYKTKSYNFSL